MKRLPKESQARVGSQQAVGPWPGSPSAIDLSESGKVHVTPPSVLREAVSPALAVLLSMKSWFLLVGFLAMAHSESCPGFFARFLSVPPEICASAAEPASRKPKATPTREAARTRRRTA